MSQSTESAERFTFRDVFAIGEFRVLWFAQLLSIAGDQLARVALTVLVFDRTHSALWTGVTYAATYLPWILGITIAGLADKYPRRTLMILSDLGRAALVMVMVIPACRPRA